MVVGIATGKDFTLKQVKMTYTAVTLVMHGHLIDIMSAYCLIA